MYGLTACQAALSGKIIRYRNIHTAHQVVHRADSVHAQRHVSIYALVVQQSGNRILGQLTALFFAVSVGIG